MQDSHGRDEVECGEKEEHVRYATRGLGGEERDELVRYDDVSHRDSRDGVARRRIGRT